MSPGRCAVNCATAVIALATSGAALPEVAGWDSMRFEGPWNHPQLTQMFP